MKPIETKFMGYRFRSRLEARWAVAFQYLGLDWRYEHEGFDLGNKGWYLPDFYLPKAKNADVFIEIKGEHPSSEEIGKMHVLMDSLDAYGLILFGDISPSSGCITFPKGYCVMSGDITEELGAYLWRENTDIDRAIWAARGARFEHGESGNV